MSNFEEIAFDKGVNISRPKVLLEKNEMYVCEGFDLEYIGILRGRDPRGEVMEVTGPYPAHSVLPYYPPVIPEPYPKPAYLIGWYKFDEGSGSVAYNSATDGSLGNRLLPDLTVENTGGNFWTHAVGFASNTGYQIKEYAYSPISPSLSFNGTSKSCAGMFFKVLPTIDRGGCLLHIQKNTSLGALSSVIVPSYISDGGGQTRIDTGGSSCWPCSGTYSQISLNTWYFVFILDGYHVVRSDGTKFSVSGIMATALITHTDINVGCDFYNPVTMVPGTVAQCTWGDTIIYNYTTLSVDEWGEWYDDQRSRYGMAARSGW